MSMGAARARIVRVFAMSAMLGALLAGGCTHAAGKVPVDNPKLLPYVPPDIDELTGIDSSTPAEPDADGTAAGAAQKPQT